MKAALDRPRGDVKVPVRVAAPLPARVDLLGRLEGICAGRGLGGLALRLADLAAFIDGDMNRFETTFGALPDDPRLVGRTASHLLAVGGKRLRPMCVSLAARVGGEPHPAVANLAVAVELVHSATLLHDDVVDLSDTRRGAPTARTVYSNAASIFAGDWLLIEALRRVERCAVPGLLTALFDTIEEMIFAESIQLENRGRVEIGRDAYFRVVEGKTASVFRWAMTAGAMASGLEAAARLALERYGLHLGVAFQAVDDLLDLTGDASRTGKALFTDLREGKMTYPVILAVERDPALRTVIEGILTLSAEAEVEAEAWAQVVSALRRTDAVRDCLAMAHEHAAAAIDNLADLPEGRARRALATVAEAIVDRDL